MSRVSIRRAKENSFQMRVPIGKTQASGSDASMALPAGSAIQRRLSAPSDQSGYCGEKEWTSAATILAAKSE